LFTEEGGGLFDVRKTILGPMQQGGNPTPFDRIQGTRLAHDGMHQLFKKLKNNDKTSTFTGFSGSKTSTYQINELCTMVECDLQRPSNQWWESLIDITSELAIKPMD
jgi:6-phosphofructokinase 1